MFSSRYFLLLIIALIGLSCSAAEGFAAITRTYIPAPKIALTGTTSDVRFDTASALFGTVFSGAYLDTHTMNMSGAFYMSGIGWAVMSTGTLQVRLNCNGQPLSALSAICNFEGLGWSENIGELDFSGIDYDPINATISGDISSFAGDFSVNGVSLPLRPVRFHQSLLTLIASHASPLSIQEAYRYGIGTWQLRVAHHTYNVIYEDVSGGSLGVFSADISLADEYTFTVTDPQGSQTRFDGVDVTPSILSQTLDTTANLFIKQFCDAYSFECPDGNILSPTLYQRTGVGIIADGVEKYDFRVKTRDRYGNRVDSGNMRISYTGTLQSIQIPSPLFSTLYTSAFDPEVFSSIFFTFLNRETSFTLNGTDVVYSIASLAPTDASNTLRLESIDYNGIQIITDPVPLDFIRPYTTTITPPSSVLVGTSNVFNGIFTSATTTVLNPELINLLLIGEGANAEFRDLTSTPLGIQNQGDIDWMIDVYNPSSIVFSPGATFSFSGLYAPFTSYPIPETVYLHSLLHYRVGLIDVVYSAYTDTLIAQYNASRVKILGQNNAQSEYGTIGTTRKMRSDLFNKLRKNIALISRGRVDYSDVPYVVYTTPVNITDSMFDNKQTIIVIGSDIVITQDIQKDPDNSLAIIALTDTDGNGGNITIDPAVTDITAGVFAEKSVLGGGDRQLYIHGALVSANTLGETAAGICPYYVNPCDDPQKYDLEYLRDYDSTDPLKVSANPKATQHPGSSLIIEYDMRLQSDPPPGIPE